ncbi:indolepyruvate ferredoxin oxidoreductase subunit alpha [Planctomycetota bacterium]
MMPTTVDVSKCDGCESCVEACPTDSIKVVDEKAVIDNEECIDCGACIEECPNEAISEIGE